jgi:hypothetical protein
MIHKSMNEKEVAGWFEEMYAQQPREIKAKIDNDMAILMKDVKNMGETSAKIALVSIYLLVDKHAEKCII